MRTGLLPFCRKWRKNRSEVGKRHCEWQIQLMEGGPKGWAVSPAFLFHLEPCCTPLLPTPSMALLSWGILHGFLFLGAPALHLFPCCPWSEETIPYLPQWDSASNPALHTLKPQHPIPHALPSHSRTFPRSPLYYRDAQLFSLLPVMEPRRGWIPVAPVQLCWRERERTGALARSPPSHVPPGWGGRKHRGRSLPAGWPQAWLACAGAGVQTGLFPLLFLSILHFAVQGSERGAHQPRKLGLLSHGSPVTRTVTSVLWHCHPRSGTSLSPSLRFDGHVLGWTSPGWVAGTFLGQTDDKPRATGLGWHLYRLGPGCFLERRRRWSSSAVDRESSPVILGIRMQSPQLPAPVAVPPALAMAQGFLEPHRASKGAEPCQRRGCRKQLGIPSFFCSPGLKPSPLQTFIPAYPELHSPLSLPHPG